VIQFLYNTCVGNLYYLFYIFMIIRARRVISLVSDGHVTRYRRYWIPNVEHCFIFISSISNYLYVSKLLNRSFIGSITAWGLRIWVFELNTISFIGNKWFFGQFAYFDTLKLIPRREVFLVPDAVQSCGRLSTMDTVFLTIAIKLMLIKKIGFPFQFDV